LGNLTLTGYNSEDSDRPFKDKRDMDGGFKVSPLKLNAGLGQLEQWNEDAIKVRAGKLAESAIKVWQPLKVLRRIPTVIPSSTSPYHIVTDAGNAFLKMPNNPQGPAAIVSEFIGTQLAAWFGLSTFEYCMMQVCEADLNVDRQDQTDLVMAFVTHEDDGDTWKGSAKELQTESV